VNDLPNGWVSGTLGEVGTWGSGGTPRKGHPEFYDGAIPWAVIGDLNDSLVSSTQTSITPLGLKESSAKPIKAGSLLVAMYGSIGKLGIAGMDMATNQAIAFFKPNDMINSKYLFWYLLSQRQHLGTAGKGATQQNISQTILKSWPVPIPPAPEQQRIVDAIEEHFSRIDAAEGSMRRASAQIERFRRKSFSQLFDQPGWNWTTLGEIADIKGGVTKDAKKQSHPGFVEVPYLRVANVQRGHLDLNEVTKIRVPPATLEALRLAPGDILLNEGGDRDKLGRGWVWEGQVENCIHQNHVFRARLRDPAMNPRFFSTHANTWGRSWFETNGKQTTNLASISLSTLKTLPVPVPSFEEQTLVMAELERRASVADALLQSLESGSRGAGSLRRSIFNMAFSGRLVPQLPNAEPANVLLECNRPEQTHSPTHRRNQNGLLS